MKKIYLTIVIAIITVISFYTAKADSGPFEPIVTTTITSIGVNTANTSTTISLLPTDHTITEYGIVWSTSSNPTKSLVCYNRTGNPGPSFTYTIGSVTPLTQGGTYHVRGYAVNDEGTFYSENLTFTTIPTLPEWGLIALISLTACFGGWFVWKKFS
jgi:hypothetical protein